MSKKYVQYSWNGVVPPYKTISSTGAYMEGRLYPINGRWIGAIFGTEEQIAEAISLCVDYEMIALDETDAERYIAENDLPLLNERLSVIEDALLAIVLGE